MIHHRLVPHEYEHSSSEYRGIQMQNCNFLENYSYDFDQISIIYGHIPK
jgi:hypothetical protein